MVSIYDKISFTLWILVMGAGAATFVGGMYRPKGSKVKTWLVQAFCVIAPMMPGLFSMVVLNDKRLFYIWTAIGSAVDMLALFFLCAIFLYWGDTWDKLLWLSFLQIFDLRELIWTPIAQLIDPAYDQYFPGRTASGMLLTGGLLVAGFFLIFADVALCRWLRQKLHLSKRAKKIICVVIWCGFALAIWVSLGQLRQTINNVSNAGMYGTLMPQFVLIVLLLAVLLVLFWQQARQTAENEEAFRRMQLDYFLSQREQEEAMRSLRHDITNHVTAAGALLREGKHNQALEYLRQVETHIRETRQLTMHTGSRVADAVLTEKAASCRAEGIGFSFEGQLPQGDVLPEQELLAILAGLTDAAMAAARQMPDAQIRLQAETAEKELDLLLSPAPGVQTTELRAAQDAVSRCGGTIERSDRAIRVRLPRDEREGLPA